MSTATRLLLALIVGGFVLVVATIGVGAAAVYAAGSIAVEVDEHDGGRFDVNVPAGLAHVAIALAPTSVLDEALHEAEPYLPALHEGWEAFCDAPDFVVVDAQSGNDHVRVEKRDGRLTVTIDSSDAKIRVAVPLRTVGSLLARLDSASHAS